MLRRSYGCLLRSVLVVLIARFIDGVASDCIPDLVYMCEVPRITATVHQVAVVAPGKAPSCAPEAAFCTALITARQGERIMVAVNTGISISPCNDDGYVQFTDGSHTSPRHCQVSPPTAPTTTPATGVAPLYLSKTNSMTVRYRGSGSESFMSIYIRAIGCPHEDLIERNNIQVLDEAFNRNGYRVNVTCAPGYLLSNTSTSASAYCIWHHANQTYSWSNNRKFECQDGSNGAAPQQESSPLIGGIVGGAVGGAIVLVVLILILFIFIRKHRSHIEVRKQYREEQKKDGDSIFCSLNTESASQTDCLSHPHTNTLPAENHREQRVKREQPGGQIEMIENELYCT